AGVPDRRLHGCEQWRLADREVVLVLATGTAEPDTVKPSVPGGVRATATSATSAKVAWTASTDNVGVTGYDVYRDGSKLTSVPGSATSFTDPSLGASTTYTYAVDAFDAAGSTSALSAGAPVTTPQGSGGGAGPC